VLGEGRADAYHRGVLPRDPAPPSAARPDRRSLARGLAAGLAIAALTPAGCLAPRPTRSAAPGGLPRHHTLVLRTPALRPDPAFGETAWLESPHRFDQALVSWNVDVPDGSGALFQVQVRATDGRTSPWLDVGDWGALPDGLTRTTRFAGGHVDVDTLVLDGWTEAGVQGAALRVRMRSAGPAAARLALLAVTYSDRHGRYTPAPAPERLAMPARAVERLSLPYRSQRSAAPALRPRICSPTSVAMVLASAGVQEPLERVAALAYAPLHDLYGVWPRNVQAAYSLGIPGFLARFEGWAPAHAVLAAGVPLVISVKAGPGELEGAPYQSTDGHLLVLSGVDAAGDLLVHDPAAADIFGGVTTYARTDLERCWLANGGTAYVLVPPPAEVLAIAGLC